MGARAEALADQFEQANQAVIDCVLGDHHGDFSVSCPAEGWTAAALGGHIGSGHIGILNGLIKPAVNGEEIPPFTMSDFDEGNAKFASENSAMPLDQIVAQLRDNGAVAADYVRSLSDEDLDRTTSMPMMGEHPVTAQQLIEWVLIGHTREHGQSLRSGLGLHDHQHDVAGAPA
jgi:hypothetical protein